MSGGGKAALPAGLDFLPERGEDLLAGEEAAGGGGRGSGGLTRYRIVWLIGH